MIKVNNIKLALNDDLDIVFEKTMKATKLRSSDIRNFKIIKESVDARKKSNIVLVYQTQFECDNEATVVKKAGSVDVQFSNTDNSINSTAGFQKHRLSTRPIVIGSGPAGLFAGLILAKNGLNPLILERGSSVEQRDLKIKNFFNKGILDTDCNIQFGEGGAGTYSDGKLTTRIKDIRCDMVISEFIRAGAPKDIEYSYKPHIGTDILIDVVRNLRNQIISLGGEVRFDSKVTNFYIKDGRIKRITVNEEYDIECEVILLAIGHSARDTYEVLLSKGVRFEQKPFAIGVRVEHLQSMIDESQYGVMANHPKLKGASYRLAYNSKTTGRSCYSFCMCPGGMVVAAASEQQRLVINGMSEYARDKTNANSAIVVGVSPADFGSSHPLAGSEFQRHYENLAFLCGGKNYKAPVQLVGDFLKDQVSTRVYEIQPSYPIGYEFADLRKCLPVYVTDTIKEGMQDFSKKINGFASDHAVFTGIETRTSSPVKIPRNDGFEAVDTKGVFPVGEGAGYAGGIVSAAVDGIRVAEFIVDRYEV